MAKRDADTLMALEKEVVIHLKERLTRRSLLAYDCISSKNASISFPCTK